MTSEDLLGFIWSRKLWYQERDSGYALAITSNRVVGAPKSALLDSLEVYLGPGANVKQNQRERATMLFVEVMANKNLEVSKDSITRITWKDGGVLDGAHFLFTTREADFQIDTVAHSDNIQVVNTVNIILGSLVTLAPDRLYNSKTGALFHDEMVEKMKKNPRKFKAYDPNLP